MNFLSVFKFCSIEAMLSESENIGEFSDISNGDGAQVHK